MRVPIVLLALALSLSSSWVLGDPVQTEYGPVEGVESSLGSVEVFRGIPYAAPPLADLRWRPPQPPVAWSAPRRCDQFGPKSLQKRSRSGGRQSEDCLYLNLWRPRGSVDKKLPVMVWIHGGGFTQGSGHEPGYNGAQLAARGVIVVTINYRLGALGFFAHPALSRESSKGASGNYAILDQIAALKWVQSNVSTFGGDKKNVTIFGESAGGTSVYLLTATPLSKGLFHRAILQSAWLDPGIFRNLKEANENGPAVESDGVAQVDAILGSRRTQTDQELLAELRALPAEEVLEKFKPRWPVITEGWVFPKSPHRIYRAGEQHEVPVLVGTNRDEGTMFAPAKPFGGRLENFDRAMEERFGEQGKSIAAFYRPSSESGLRKTLVQQITDSWFVQPAREFANAMDQNGSRVWMYHFTKPVWGWMGAAHAAEIRYVFGNLDDPSASDAELSESFMDYWVRFAKSGDPNGGENPQWPAYTAAGQEYLQMDEPLSVGRQLRAEACDLLDRVLTERRGVTIGEGVK